MSVTPVHPGYALAWTMKEEQIQKDVQEYTNKRIQEALDWFHDNIVKVAHPDLFNNGKDIKLRKNSDGSVDIIQEDDPEIEQPVPEVAPAPVVSESEVQPTEQPASE